MDEIPIRLKLSRLFCYFGADEGNSEPYMWVIGFKFDGSTVQQLTTSLGFTPDFFLSQGSHGNLVDGSVGIGTKIAIPASVGTWETTLKAITLTGATGTTTKVPGTLGFIAVVMEENNVAFHAAEQGHQALNTFVQNTLQDFVTGINLVLFRGSVEQRITAGAAVEDAMQDEIRAQLTTVGNIIRSGARAVVETAMRNAMHLGELIWAAFDKDDVIGNEFHVVTSKQLINESDFTVDFTDPMFENPSMPEAGEWGYNLHSFVKAKVRWKAIPFELPADHAIQIQGILQGYSRDQGTSYISYVGGVVAGKPWRLRRSEACDMITNGTKSFYVLNADGSHTPVLVESPSGSYWSYLTTPADNNESNNLSNLPKLYELPDYITRELEADPFG